MSTSYCNDGISLGKKKINKIPKTNDTKNDETTLKTNLGPMWTRPKIENQNIKWFGLFPTGFS